MSLLVYSIPDLFTNAWKIAWILCPAAHEGSQLPLLWLSDRALFGTMVARVEGFR